jgi:hypothetical protein
MQAGSYLARLIDALDTDDPMEELAAIEKLRGFLDRRDKQLRRIVAERGSPVIRLRSTSETVTRRSAAQVSAAPTAPEEAPSHADDASDKDHEAANSKRTPSQRAKRFHSTAETVVVPPDRV